MNIALDLDGTVITCKQRQLEVLRAVSSYFQIKIDTNEIWGLKREGYSTYQALVQLNTPAETAKAISEKWLDVIENPFWLSFDSVFPGVIEVLSEMRQNLSLNLVTARKSAVWVDVELWTLNIRDHFDQIFVVDPRNSANAKAKVLRQLKPVAFFGDTESDFYASEKAGIPFIALSTGQRSASYMQLVTGGTIYPSFQIAWQAIAPNCAAK